MSATSDRGKLFSPNMLRVTSSAIHMRIGIRKKLDRGEILMIQLNGMTLTEARPIRLNKNNTSVST